MLVNIFLVGLTSIFLMVYWGSVYAHHQKVMVQNRTDEANLRLFEQCSKAYIFGYECPEIPSYINVDTVTTNNEALEESYLRNPLSSTKYILREESNNVTNAHAGKEGMYVSLNNTPNATAHKRILSTLQGFKLAIPVRNDLILKQSSMAHKMFDYFYVKNGIVDRELSKTICITSDIRDGIYSITRKILKPGIINLICERDEFISQMRDFYTIQDPSFFVDYKDDGKLDLNFLDVRLKKRISGDNLLLKSLKMFNRRIFSIMQVNFNRIKCSIMSVLAERVDGFVNASELYNSIANVIDDKIDENKSMLNTYARLSETQGIFEFKLIISRRIEMLFTRVIDAYYSSTV